MTLPGMATMLLPAIAMRDAADAASPMISTFTGLPLAFKTLCMATPSNKSPPGELMLSVMDSKYPAWLMASATIFAVMPPPKKSAPIASMMFSVRTSPAVAELKKCSVLGFFVINFPHCEFNQMNRCLLVIQIASFTHGAILFSMSDLNVQYLSHKLWLHRFRFGFFTDDSLY